LRNFRPLFLLLSSVLIILVFIYLSLAIYVANHAEKDTTSKADTILVLGARSYINGAYNPCLEARVDHAADLYKAKYASKIIVSGGNDREDNVNEAQTMKKIAQEHGVPNSAILLENAATSTYENVVNSQKILSKNHLKTVIIVTEPFHMARASLVADKLGLIYTQSPASISPCWVANKYFSKYFLKEPVAIMIYKLQNKL
jgi:uncharacterized SAM-binding protein YcdF (DUF218 family)